MGTVTLSLYKIEIMAVLFDFAFIYLSKNIAPGIAAT
jgi:hypothetical protein